MTSLEALCLERGDGRAMAVCHPALHNDEEPTARQIVDQNLRVLHHITPSYGSVSVSTSDSLSSKTASTLSSCCSSYFSREGIPIPLKLRPFVKRLEDIGELTDEEICSILFIIRLADSMLKVAYAAFLTRSFVDELRKKLGVEDLDLEIEISATRWTYQQGAIMTYHRFVSDYDGHAMQKLSRIALGVLEDSITQEGLQKIQRCEEYTEGSSGSKGASIGHSFERFYREFPGRISFFPVLASTGCVVYFGGTMVDFMVCLVTGTVAGMIHQTCSKHPQLSGLEEILVATSTSILSVLSTILFPGAVCFPAQVLGALFCFLYGISFVMSLYEITQNLVATGLARFCLATLKSLALAFGVAIGLWVAGFGGPERLQGIVAVCNSSCTNLRHAVDPFYFVYFYPVMAIGALMHLRVSPKHWPICLLTQLVALKSQYLLSFVWHQPVFVSNFIPAFLATICAHILIVTLHRLHLTSLAVKPTAFLLKKLQRRKDIKEPLTDATLSLPLSSSPADESSPNVLRFVDNGWADQGDTRQGYSRNKQFQYQRSDLWFCLVPSLYLLVPGAAIWRIAFFSMVESSTQHDEGLHIQSSSFQSLASAVFVVGMGQVMGIRVALAALWAFTELWRKRTGSNKSLP